MPNIGSEFISNPFSNYLYHEAENDEVITRLIPIGLEGARAIAQMRGITRDDLEREGFLRLDLGNNPIGPEGAQAIAQMRGITRLYLNYEREESRFDLGRIFGLFSMTMLSLFSMTMLIGCMPFLSTLAQDQLNELNHRFFRS